MNIFNERFEKLLPILDNIFSRFENEIINELKEAGVSIKFEYNPVEELDIIEKQAVLSASGTTSVSIYGITGPIENNVGKMYPTIQVSNSGQSGSGGYGGLNKEEE